MVNRRVLGAANGTALRRQESIGYLLRFKGIPPALQFPLSGNGTRVKVRGRNLFVRIRRLVHLQTCNSVHLVRLSSIVKQSA